MWRKSVLTGSRNELVNILVAYAKKICNDLEIVMYRRRRKKKLMDKELWDAELSYQTEFRRFFLLNRVI